MVGQRVAAWLAAQPGDNGAEAEGTAVMRTAVPDSARLAVDEDDAHLAACDPCDQAPLPLQFGERADVVPLAHVLTRPSRSP